MSRKPIWVLMLLTRKPLDRMDGIDGMLEGAVRRREPGSVQ